MGLFDEPGLRRLVDAGCPKCSSNKLLVRTYVDGLVPLMFTVLCCSANLTACRSSSEQNTSSTTSPPAPPTDAPNLKIWISKTGSVEIDGKQVEVESVGPMLAELAQRKGEVFYGRDAAEEDPHPNGVKVLQLVMASRLRVRMSTKRDYSDAVSIDGNPK